TIDHDRGVAVSAVNLPLEDVPIRDLVAERTGLPVFVDNDATVAALAEHLYGAARGAENAVMLTIGTGIGGGLILGGEVYRGSTGAGAELGHTVIDLDGPPCQGNCPGRGCVETLASGTAVGREGREAAEHAPDSALGKMQAGGRTIDGVAVTEAALAGDAAARGVFDLVGMRLGAALASFANIFEPEVFVIGGGVIAAGDLLLDPARRELEARALPPMKKIPVFAAELGSDAGMIGAAAMARIELERG
ncbi:MAG TPA: ROK family protein, partial [Solirubrobacterales bacterium]|nr:ROK family protein [Solirubrobacterales bacterium]